MEALSGFDKVGHIIILFNFSFLKKKMSKL